MNNDRHSLDQIQQHCNLVSYGAVLDYVGFIDSIQFIEFLISALIDFSLDVQNTQHKVK